MISIVKNRNIEANFLFIEIVLYVFSIFFITYLGEKEGHYYYLNIFILVLALTQCLRLYIFKKNIQPVYYLIVRVCFFAVPYFIFQYFQYQYVEMFAGNFWCLAPNSIMLVFFLYWMIKRYKVNRKYIDVLGDDGKFSRLPPMFNLGKRYFLAANTMPRDYTPIITKASIVGACAGMISSNVILNDEVFYKLMLMVFGIIVSFISILFFSLLIFDLAFFHCVVKKLFKENQ